MTFSMPPRPPPPPRLLHVEGVVLLYGLLYASRFLCILLLFLLLAICVPLIFLVKLPVVPPVVLVMCLLSEGRLVVLSFIGASQGKAMRGCKALHMHKAVGAPATHVFPKDLY